MVVSAHIGQIGSTTRDRVWMAMKELHLSQRQSVASNSSVAAISPDGVRVFINGRPHAPPAALSMRWETLELCIVTGQREASISPVLF